jgi:hypothetical protein
MDNDSHKSDSNSASDSSNSETETETETETEIETETEHGPCTSITTHKMRSSTKSINIQNRKSNKGIENGTESKSRSKSNGKSTNQSKLGMESIHVDVNDEMPGVPMEHTRKGKSVVIRNQVKRH